jgi:hypothetical protein
MRSYERQGIAKYQYVELGFKSSLSLPPRTWSSDPAKLGLPIAATIQLCPVLLTIFVNHFIIFKPSAELFPGLFVIR